jgi:hypothetical protein
LLRRQRWSHRFFRFSSVMGDWAATGERPGRACLCRDTHCRQEESAEDET